MLRRSVPFRLLAVALAGITLGACSGTADDATAPSGPASANNTVNPLNFYKSTANLFFDVTGGATPAPQVVEVSGIVVTTTPYVRVLSISYSPSIIKDWLRITQRPGLLADGTLGVRLTISVRPVPGLDQGATATIPITVPGARNGPQVITVTTNVLNCAVASTLAYPANPGNRSSVVGSNDPTDCTSPLIASGSRRFDVYAVTVPANAQFALWLRGSCSSGGTQGDPYVYLFDPAAGAVLAQDDDGSPCGLDSYLPYTNTSGQPKLYYLIASQWCSSCYGTHTLEVENLGVGSSTANFSRRSEVEVVTPEEVAKRARLNRQ